MKHIPDERLLVLLDERPERAGGRTPDREHLSGCVRCRKRLEQLRGVAASLEPCRKDRETLLAMGDGCPENRDPLELYAYAAGTLPDRKQAEVREHLNGCGFCAHLVEGFAEEPAAPVPPAFQAGSRPPLRDRLSFLFPRPRWAAAGALACVLLAVVLIREAVRPPYQDLRVMVGPREAVRSHGAHPLLPGETLRSGDRFWVAVQPHRDLNLYAFLHTSAGRVQLLFPAPEIDLANPLEGGVSYTVPPDGFWPLDDQTGTETLLLACSEKPVEGVEAIRAELERAVPPAPDAGERADAAERLLRKHFRQVMSYSFQHR